MIAADAAGERSAARWLIAWIVFCTLAGLVLRILGADGDLFQDEIWTFSLLRTVSSPLGIFLDMSADNNHFLNTLYLYYVGAGAAPLAQRALSIALGTAAIGAAAAVFRREHWSAPALAAALFAFCYPLVNHGSEARGYAGFLLCTLISIGLLERELAAPSRRNRIWLGISNLLGTLFQPIMLGTIAVLVAWCVWDRVRHGNTLRQALSAAQQTFSVTVRLLLIVLVLAVIAVYRIGGYKILATVPFTPGSVIDGYGGMLRLLFGIPAAVPAWLVLAVTLLGVAIALYAGRNRLGRRVPLYAIAIFALPAALFCARLPNLAMNRYHLLSSVALLLLMTELFKLAWRAGGWRRTLGLAVCAGFLIGNALELADFYAYGRGSYQEVTRTIGTSESPRVTSNLDGATSTILEFYAERLGVPISYVTNRTFCGSGVTWLVEAMEQPGPRPDAISFGGPACPTPFRKVADYPARAGWTWTLYRAE